MFFNGFAFCVFTYLTLSGISIRGGDYYFFLPSWVLFSGWLLLAMWLFHVSIDTLKKVLDKPTPSI
jgi:hypothetical protein